jgi:hypothetical protein
MHRLTIRPAAAVAACLALTPSLFAQNPNAGIAPSGQQLTVDIDCPGVLDESDTSFLVDVCADLGAPSTLNVNVLFVLDLSGSMSQFLPAGPNLPGDANGDGQVNQFIDAAVLALVNLSASLGSSANVDIGLIGFGGAAAAADISPLGGNQVWISPPNADVTGNAVPDIEDVLRSAKIGPPQSRFLLFNRTPDVLSNNTNYAAALTAASNAFALQPPGEANIVFFVSDGQPTIGAFPPALGALIAAHDPVINAFGIGPGGALACNPGQPLDILATQSGGTCAAVVNPANLIAELPEAAFTSITSLSLAVNGNPVAASFDRDTNQICLDDIEIIQELDLFGTNFLEATATTADGLVVTATKELTKTACLLFAGFETDNTPYVPGDIDMWLVKPRLSFNVTESNVPTFTVPNNPALMGKDMYFQVLMHNQYAFPQNPVQMSNGVKVTVVGGVTPYGGATGIWAWHSGSTAPGGTFSVHFDVLAM